MSNCGIMLQNVAPEVELNSPSHLAQCTDPVKYWYMPAAQSAHVVNEVAPVKDEYVPALQLLQLVVPTVSWY